MCNLYYKLAVINNNKRVNGETIMCSRIQTEMNTFFIAHDRFITFKKQTECNEFINANENKHSLIIIRR